MARITKTAARKMLKDVPEDKAFWVSDGRVLKNLAELETALGEMHDDTYRYHANEFKSDFTNWIRDVIGDDELAMELQRSTSRTEAAKSVASRIAFLNSVLRTR